tara:strand:+ start:3519 stop:5582 length:2064 start_codon:yes stop_codon:yes gene_type:complete
LARSNVELTVNASQALRALGQVNSQTTALTGAVNTLRNAFIGVGAAAIVRSTVNQATNYERLNVRLKVLTNSTSDYKKALELVDDAQSKFAISQTEALDQLAGLQARLGPLGTSMEDVATIFNGFNTAAILSGATLQEQSGAMRQLVQALGAGALRGEEFNSIAENMSAVLVPVAEVMGVGVGQLRALAAEGKITKEVMIEAFEKIEEEGTETLEKLIAQDPTKVFQVLGNEVQRLSITVGQFFAPAILEATKLLIDLVKAVQAFVDSGMGKAVLISISLATALKVLVGTFVAVKAAVVATTASMSAVGAASLVASGNLASLSVAASAGTTSVLALSGALKILKLALIKTGIGALIVGAGFLTAEILKIVDAQKEWNRLIKEGTKDELTAKIEELNESIKEQHRIIEQGNSAWGIFLSTFFQVPTEVEQAEINIRKFTREITTLQKVLSNRRIWGVGTESILATSSAMEALSKITVQTSEQFEEVFADKFGKYMTSVHDFGTQSAKALQNAFQSMEDSLVDFVQTGKLNFKDFANSVIADMIRIAVRQQLIAPLLRSFGSSFAPAPSGIGYGEAFSGGDIFKPGALDNLQNIPFGAGTVLPGRAMGGPVSAGSPYLVGEKGPELFIPNSSGNIAPNSSLGGVVVNVDATGSAVEGDSQTSRELGRMIGAAVQAELIRQKRPGGILTR